MLTILSIAGLLLIVMIHELGHAHAMIRNGIRIKEIGLGWPIRSLPHFRFRLNKKIPSVTLHPLLLGAYVEPYYSEGKKIEGLPYLDMAFVYGAGVWANTVFAMLIVVVLQMFAPEQMPTYKAVINSSAINLTLTLLYVGILVILFLCPRLFCGYIIPPLGIFVTYLTVKILTEHFRDSMGGPVSIIMDSAPRMATWVGAGKEIAILSLAIGLLNMLPLPPLDGGQIIRNLLKRWFGERWSLAYSGFGVLCVLCLIALALFGDIQKLIHLIF